MLTHPGAVSSGLVVCVAILMLSPAGALVQTAPPGPPDLRIPVEGKQQLVRKVIVCGDRVTLHSTLPDVPDAPGESVDPFAVFIKLKLDNQPASKHEGEVTRHGALFVRVGDLNNSPIGYLKVRPRRPRVEVYRELASKRLIHLAPEQLAKMAADPFFAAEVSEDIVDWNTRFALFPRAGATVPFETYLSPDYGVPVTRYTGRVGGVGQMFIAPILDKPADPNAELFPVTLFTATHLPSRTGTDPDTFRPERLTLEVVFVIDTTASNDLLLEAVNRVLKECGDLIAKDEGLKGAVRFGVVTYQDDTPGLTPAKMISKLTDDIDAIKKQLGELRVASVGRIEVQTDILAGLKMALQDAGWTANSSKHVVLVGGASAFLTDPKDPSKPHPKNTTKLDYAKIQQMARSESGAEYVKAVSSKMLHAIHLQNPDQRDDDLLARQQFRDLAENGRRCKGYFASVNGNDLNDRAVKELAGGLSRGIEAVASARKGDLNGAQRAVQHGPPADTIYRTLWTIGGDPLPVTAGFAAERNKDGRQVAEIRVMIRERELKDLRNALDFLYRPFGDTTPDERKYVTGHLTAIKQVIAGSVAGQRLASHDNAELEKKSLQDLISDLPLAPGVLKTNPVDIARMDDKRFKVWLTDLKNTADRAETLLEEANIPANPKLMEVNHGKGADGKPRVERLFFIRLAELP